MSIRSKHSSSKKEKLGKKEKKKKLEDSDADFESSEEELDLTKECHPIGYYINDRAEMINQMFSVIKGNKLKAMLPPILKDYDTEQLKLQCLDQLLGMSEKRITCILEGDTLETSSESEVLESEEYNSEDKNGTTSGSSSERSEDSQGDGYTNDADIKHKKRKGDAAKEGKGGKLPKMGSEPPEQGKTLLEILELEMRARAIRALLKQSGSEKSVDQGGEETKSGNEANTNGVKEVTGEVVDLTECEDEELPTCFKKKTPAETDIDKRVTKFEEKIEKSKSDKVTFGEEDKKSKKLQAELELRNKLFKKKIYRTRQQRMESEEEEKIVQKCDEKPEESVVIKQEPGETEIVDEDPEEGEISTSEDEYPVEIKQEVSDAGQPETTIPEEPAPEEFTPKMDEGAERVTAIDNGTFVSNSNMENKARIDEVEVEQESKKDETEEENKNELEAAVEGTSWRDRWLQKDGVQKLVKSSKIYAKVKKRIAEKCLRSKEEVLTPYEANSDSNSNSKMEVIEGSIEEYERLLGKSKENEESENGNSQESSGTGGGTYAPENGQTVS